MKYNLSEHTVDIQICLPSPKSTFSSSDLQTRLLGSTVGLQEAETGRLRSHLGLDELRQL